MFECCKTKSGVESDEMKRNEIEYNKHVILFFEYFMIEYNNFAILLKLENTRNNRK